MSDQLTHADDAPLDWWAKILGGDEEARLSFIRGSLSSPTETYFGLSNPARPTMLIDTSSRSGVAEAVGKPGQGRARAIAGKALRIPGVSKLLPRKLGLSSPRSTMRDLLAEIAEIEVVLSASCGPLRPNRKPVVRGLDRRGALQVVAKVGWDPLTSALVQTEAAAIADVLKTDPEVIVAPEVLEHDTWRGLEVLAVSPLAIDNSRSPETTPDQTIEALVELSTIDRTTVGLEDSGFIARLYDRLANLASDDDDQPLTVLESVIADGHSVDTGGFHGDWSPWNTQPLGGGRLLVWDWERFATDVPIGIDLVHYLFQVERFVNKSEPVEARSVVTEQAADRLAELDVDPDHADLLVTLYLLEAVARNSEGALSTQLHDRRASLVEALVASDEVDEDSRKAA